jgi:hypothetical protein
MPRTTTSRTQKPKRRKIRVSDEPVERRKDNGIRSLRGDLEHQHSPQAFRTALRLRMSIADSYFCPEPACKRRQICARPVLECHYRHRADEYDWDDNWYYCQRKHIYGKDRYDGMPGVRGGTEEFIEKQRQEHRDKYDANTWEM